MRLNMGVVKSPATTHSDRQTDTHSQLKSRPTVLNPKEWKELDLKLGEGPFFSPNFLILSKGVPCSTA